MAWMPAEHASGEAMLRFEPRTTGTSGYRRMHMHAA
jgi:hypothetical protein